MDREREREGRGKGGEKERPLRGIVDVGRKVRRREIEVIKYSN